MVVQGTSSGSMERKKHAAKVAEGDGFESSEMYSKAASCYEQAFRMNPGDPEPLVKKIKALLFGSSEAVMDEADRLVRLFPDNAMSYETRGEVLSSHHMHSDAVDDFVTALKLDPDSVEACKCRGHSLAALGRHKEAVNAYRRAVRLRPDDSTAAYCLCSGLEDLGRYHDALAVLKAYQPFDGARNYLLYRHMGRVFGLLGDVGRSFANYVKSVKLNRPKAGADPRVLRRYREIKLLGRHIKRLDPLHPMSFYEAGTRLLDANWIDTALNMLITGARFNPMPWPYMIVGNTRMRYLDYTQAIWAYKRALELSDKIPPMDLDALYGNLIKCLFGCGRYREVLEYCAKAVSLGITGRNIEQTYRVVLEMGPEPVDRDQVAGGWTAKTDI